MKIRGIGKTLFKLILFILVVSLLLSGIFCVSNLDASLGIQTDNPLQKLIAGKGIPEVETEVEQCILDFANKERIKEGLTPLEYDQKLSEIAKAHTIDMITNKFFSSTNPKGQNPSDRARAADCSPRKYLSESEYREEITESIFKIPYGFSWFKYIGKYNSESIANEIIKSDMENRNESNILDKTNSNMGIGVKYAKGYYYVTLDFW